VAASYPGYADAKPAPAPAGYEQPQAAPPQAAPPSAVPRGAAPPQPNGPRKGGGSHRAARHGKPTRGWRGRKPDKQAEDTDQPEPLGTDIQELSDDLSLAMPSLFSGTADGGVAPSAPQEAWQRTESSSSDGSMPPWDLGGRP
jgi:hypothetical protein